MIERNNDDCVGSHRGLRNTLKACEAEMQVIQRRVSAHDELHARYLTLTPKLLVRRLRNANRHCQQCGLQNIGMACKAEMQVLQRRVSAHDDLQARY